MIVGPEDFATLHDACMALDTAGVPYVIGGGTVVTLWGRNRRTKDFDIFLNRRVLGRAMDALSLAGFTTTDTEKRWLYKAWRGETLVDLIAESRGRINVDAETLAHARIVTQHGFEFKVMGPEDTLYRKALTLTEGRPDWYDGLSILLRSGDELDWVYFRHLARRHPRRILSFLLFAQTELHAPESYRTQKTDDLLFHGNAPGPVPEWLVFDLVQQIWLERKRGVAPPPRLAYYPKAA